jgi:hypothetical protein
MGVATSGARVMALTSADHVPPFDSPAKRKALFRSLRAKASDG